MKPAGSFHNVAPNRYAILDNFPQLLLYATVIFIHKYRKFKIKCEFASMLAKIFESTTLTRAQK